MKKIILSIIFSLSYVYADNGCEIIGGVLFDGISSVIRMSDGGYLLVGLTNSYGIGGGDVFLVKLDANFNREWQKMIGGTKFDGGSSIIRTNDNGYLIIGSTESFSVEDINAYIVKLNQEFDLVWTKSIDGYPLDTLLGDSVSTIPSHDYGISVTESSDGSYILFIKRHLFLKIRPFIIKLSSNGNVEWVKTSDINLKPTSDLIRTNDNGYAFLAGNTIIKIDSLFNVQWSKKTTGPTIYLTSIIQTNDNGYAITGYVISTNDTNILAMKLDQNGNVQWSRAIGGSKKEVGYKIIQTNDNGYFIAGTSNTYSANNKDDIYVVKLNSSGNIEWVKAFGTDSVEYVNYVMQLNNSGYVIFGHTNLAPEGIFIVTIDANGNTCSSCSRYLNYYTYDVSISFSTQSLNFVNDSVRVFSGGTLLEGGLFATNVICAISDVLENSFDTNPSVCYSKEKVKISFGRVYDNVSIIVRDVGGREVMRKDIKNTNQAGLDIKGKDGIYFVEVRAGGKKALFKVVKAR